MDIKDIQNLIKFVAKSGANEVKLETDDFKITIKTGKNETQTIVQAHPVHHQPMVQTPIIEPNSDAGNEKEIVSEESNLITIKSPIIGTFYRKPSPDKPNFAEVGRLL